MGNDHTVPAVEFRGITKRFGAVNANEALSLQVEAGSIHGIIGENGAGKSTAMKILYGMTQPDQGEIRIRGELKHWHSPVDAICAGIGMVHQHFMLAGPCSVLDNIMLGKEELKLHSPISVIDRRAVRQRLDQIASQYSIPVEWDQRAEELPVGIQQRVEILKLLYRDANILILDEPTAVLTPQEVEALFSNLKKLRDEGKTILIITHKLKEVMSVTDRITVLRGGRVSGEVNTRDTSVQELADLMVGRKVVLQVDVPPRTISNESILEVRNLNLERHGRRGLSEINLNIRSGEIVGIAGVDGNGQTELVEAILHPKEKACLSSGAIRVLGQDITKLETDEIKALGLGVIYGDRQREGLVLGATVCDNFLLGHQRSKRFRKFLFVSNGALRLAARKAISEYDVRPGDLDNEVVGLSGGNQQKLVVAREFEPSPELLIIAQPTRGVDVGAIEFIHGQILRARSRGAAVLLISSELDEIFALSDRVLVMFGGRIVGEFLRGEYTEREVGLLMGGAKHSHQVI